MYHIPHFIAFTEQDIYNDGCQPDTCRSYTYEQSIDAGSEQALIDAICKHFDVEQDALKLNACGEEGRIDIARMEDSDGCKATESDIAAWKEGKKDLLYTVYSGQLEIKQPAKFTL